MMKLTSHCTLGIALLTLSHSVWPHTADVNQVAWQACESKPVSQQCEFKNADHDVYRGTCQLMSDAMMCVRNQPIERHTETKTNADAATSEAAQLHELEHVFAGATTVAAPSVVDCTLSGGTQSRCFTINVKAEPADYTPGPWCPESITDGDEAGGIWLEENTVYNVDGEFLKNLATFYDDDQWQLYDEVTGAINVTDTVESCAAAARPDVDPAYRNYCVQCLPDYMSEDASVTYTIPLVPVLLTGSTQGTRDSGSGVAFNGIRLDGPAPVEDILSNYTVAPFDDCGGHVNLHVGYHYHVATDCLLSVGQASEHGTAIGLAMDGRRIFTRFDGQGNAQTDLDKCGGHKVDGDDYHYHAGEQGSNAILNCLTAEVGCVSETMDEACNAASSGRPVGQGPAAGGRPDFAAVAKTLGVTEDALLDALGGPPPNVEKAAQILNIDIETLEAVLPKRGR